MLETILMQVSNQNATLQALNMTNQITNTVKSMVGLIILLVVVVVIVAVITSFMRGGLTEDFIGSSSSRSSLPSISMPEFNIGGIWASVKDIFRKKDYKKKAPSPGL